MLVLRFSSSCFSQTLADFFLDEKGVGPVTAAQNSGDPACASRLAATAVPGSFQMGELGVQPVPDLLAGETVKSPIHTGVVMVTKDNMEEPDGQNVLY